MIEVQLMKGSKEPENLITAAEAKKLMIEQVMEQFDFVMINNLIKEACMNLQNRVEFCMDRKFSKNAVVIKHIIDVFEKRGFMVSQYTSGGDINIALFWN